MLNKMKSSVITGTLVTTSVMAMMPMVSAAGNYSDVPATDPGYSAIKTLSDRNIVKGYSDGTFRPDGYISKIEALKIILNMTSGTTLQSELSSLTDSTQLTDIPTKTWYSPYVRFGQVHNVLDTNLLKTVTEFGRDDKINRAEFVHLFNKAFGVQLPSTEDALKSTSFEDVKLNSKYQWAAPSISVMENQLKYVGGYDNGTFGPGNNITRREVAFIFDRYIRSQEGFKNVKLGASGKLDPIVEKILTRIQSGTGTTTTGTGTTGTGTTNTGTTTTPTVSQGVKLVSTKQNVSIPKNAININLGTVAITAPSDKDLVIKSMKVTRSGLGNSSDIMTGGGIRAMVDGKIISSSSDYYNTSAQVGTIYFYPSLTIKKGETTNLDIVGNFNAQSGSQHSFTLTEINGATDTIKINPIELNTVYTTNYETSKLDITGTNSYQVFPGKKEQTFAKFDITAGNTDVTLKSITLSKSEGGDLNKRYANVKAYINGKLLDKSTVDIMSDKMTINNISQDLTSGSLVSIELKGDILVDGSANSNSQTLKISSASDVIAIEKTTGYNAIANNFAGMTNTVTFANVAVNYQKVSTKDITVAPGTSNVVLFDSKINSTTPLTVKKLTITPLTSVSQGAEAFTNNTISVRVNNQEIGVITNADFGPNSVTPISKDFTFFVEPDKDTSLTLVAAGVKNNNTVSGSYKFSVKLDDVRDTSNNTVTLISNSLIGNKTTIESPKITLRNATVAAPTNSTISNAGAVEVGRFGLSSTASDANLSKLTLSVTGSLSSLGDIANASSIELWDINKKQKVSNTVTIENNKLIFSNLNATITKDQVTNYGIVLTGVNDLAANYGKTLQFTLDGKDVITNSINSSSSLTVDGTVTFKTYTIGLVPPVVEVTPNTPLATNAKLATIKIKNADGDSAIKVDNLKLQIASRSTANGGLNLNGDICLRDLGSSSTCGGAGTTDAQSLSNGSGVFTFDIANSSLTTSSNLLSKNDGYVEYEVFFGGSPLWVTGDNVSVSVQTVNYIPEGGTLSSQSYVGVPSATAVATK